MPPLPLCGRRTRRGRAPACKGGIGETEHSRPQASSPETYFVLRATVTRLLRIGVSAEVGATDSNANTAVGIATNRGHLEVVALLLSSNASANGPAFGNGSTPLMIAALWNRELIAATLLRHGGALEPRGSAGSYKDRTALDLARENGRARIISLLVRTRATRVWERLRRIAPAAGAIPSARLMTRGSKIQA